MAAWAFASPSSSPAEVGPGQPANGCAGRVARPDQRDGLATQSVDNMRCPGHPIFYVGGTLFAKWGANVRIIQFNESEGKFFEEYQHADCFVLSG